MIPSTPKFYFQWYNKCEWGGQPTHKLEPCLSWDIAKHDRWLGPCPNYHTLPLLLDHAAEGNTKTVAILIPGSVLHLAHLNISVKIIPRLFQLRIFMRKIQKHTKISEMLNEMENICQKQCNFWEGNILV